MRKSPKFTFVYLALGALAVGTGAKASAADYVVRKGDSLSSIARQQYGEPVFGTKGTIQKIYKLNPALNKSTILEPGQTVVVNGKASAEVAEQPAAEAKRSVAPRAVASSSQFEEVRQPAAVGVDAPTIEGEQPEPPSPAIEKAILAAREASHGASDSHKPASEEKSEVSAATETHAPAEHAAEPAAATHEEKHEAQEEHSEHATPHHEVDEAPDNYFSIVPGYSQINQNVRDPASGTSYAFNSNPALSLELGWDHSWSRSFSTLLTYTGMQLTSQETSNASGALVIHDMYLSKFELALFNHLTSWVRFGLGAAYGDHLFIENFTGIPADPQIYKTAFFNPFVAAEFTPYESHKFDWLINLKIGSLPAQNGLGHDLAAGTEFEGEVSLVEKFNHWALVYALGYSTEDQTRTDSTETRSEWALKVGVLF